jgi:hypothetical protein
VTDKTEAKQLSPGAWRMRKSRQRRRDGLRCVQLAIKNAEIQGLISTGLLDPAECEDRRAVARALGRLLDYIPRKWWRSAVQLRGGP